MRDTQNGEKQAASSVLMIRPVAFRGNPQTALSNSFQRDPGVVDAAQEQADALREFEGLVGLLQTAGVDVVVIDDRLEPDTPDSIFPNNWVSFHRDGRVVLYPMMAPNRRAERREDILEHLSSEDGFRITEKLELRLVKYSIIEIMRIIFSVLLSILFVGTSLEAQVISPHL